VGGSIALPEALAGVIRECGGQIRTNTEVVRILVEGGRAVGVVAADGTEYRATRAVVSTIHVKHLPDLVGREMLRAEFVDGLRHWRTGVTMFVTHCALNAPPLYRLEQGPTPSVAAGITESRNELLEALAAFRRGEVRTECPPLLVVSSSVIDPTRAPAGHHTLKVVGFLPYGLRDVGPARWDAIKDEVSEALLDHFSRYTTNLTRRNILAKHVESPLDLERRNPHNYRGSCHGGDQDLAQEGSLRPLPQWGSYRLPVAGLYQTGSTTHSGASVTGAPGRNCAQVLLGDLGLSLEQAIAARPASVPT
jgi:phytoene dehydrogenase-like protein